MIRKRPELDTKNPPGQIVNFEKPLNKAIDDWMGIPVKERVLEAIGKSRGDWLQLVYELWQEDVIPEEVYLRALRRG